MRSGAATLAQASCLFGRAMPPTTRLPHVVNAQYVPAKRKCVAPACNRPSARRQSANVRPLALPSAQQRSTRSTALPGRSSGGARHRARASTVRASHRDACACAAVPCRDSAEFRCAGCSRMRRPWKSRGAPRAREAVEVRWAVRSCLPCVAGSLTGESRLPHLGVGTCTGAVASLSTRFLVYT